MKIVSPENLLRKTGVYKITNVLTDDFYIGSTSNKRGFKQRYVQHLMDLRKNRSGSIVLQNAWNKYGSEYFIFEVLEVCNSNFCLEIEQYYLNTLKPYYNICKAAGSRLGMTHSDSTKKKISQTKKLNPFIPTEEYRKKLSLAHIGKKHSLEHNKKVSLSKLGKKRPDSLRIKLIESNRKKMKPIKAVCFKTGKELVFDGVGIASRELGIIKQAIRNSIKTGYNAKGFKFYYLEK